MILGTRFVPLQVHVACPAPRGEWSYLLSAVGTSKSWWAK